MPKKVVVIPAPNIKPPLYVPGIGAAGKALTHAEAQPLLDAGLVVILEPDKPATKKKESD